MFGSYFGRYLTEQGIITKEEMEDVLQAQKTVRVKLGALAVAGGILSQQQAEKVNQLQQQEDKRFGDIAVEQEYMTQAQLDDLLSLQGSDYSTFVQSITDKGILSLGQMEQLIGQYKEANALSDEELEAMKSGDLDQIVPVFTKNVPLSDIHKTYVALIMRNLMRFVDSDICMEYVMQLAPSQFACGVEQQLYGDQMMYTGIFAEKDVLLDVASVYGQEDYKTIDADSLDAVSELLNVSNGLFVSALSDQGIELDLQPPMMYPQRQFVSAEGIAYVVPVYLSGKRINVVFSVNAEVTVS